MENKNQKRKPVKLSWEGGILETIEEKAVQIKSEISPVPKIKPISKSISGSAKIRIEKKGRGGKPVAIVFQFSDPESRNQESLKSLCSQLKTILACGGTVEESEIILIMRDIQKLKDILINKFNIHT